MAGFKINRVTSDIRLCLSELLREVKDPRVSKMLSIVKLDVTGDMSYATVYVSAIEGNSLFVMLIRDAPRKLPRQIPRVVRARPVTF